MLKNKGGAIPAIVLVIVCMITAALLAWTNAATADLISEQAEMKDNIARQTLLTDAKTFKEVPVNDFITAHPEYSEEQAKANENAILVSIYEGLDGDNSVGYIVQGEYRGYGGLVPAMVGISHDGKILGVTVLDNDETPGLGKKVEEEGFLGQFKDASSDKHFAHGDVGADEQELDAVSGATYSSVAVLKDVNLAMDVFHQIKG